MKALFIILTGVLVLVNAFFVIAEYSLVRSRKSRLQEMAEQGKRGARQALSAIDDIGDYIAACQVGITMASIGIGALGEPAIAHALEPIFGSALAHDAAVALSVVVAYLLITIVQSIVGEIAPKLYTLQHAEELARRVARPLRMSRVLFAPLIYVLNSASYALLRATGTDPDAVAEGGTPDEIKRIIAESRAGASWTSARPTCSPGVFHLHEQEARQVMTPIPAVVTVDLSETVQDALRRCVSTGHSRLVVTEDENQDRVKGIVHVNQLVKLMMNEGYEAHFDKLVRAAPIVPETKPLDDLLADLQRERTELAVVVDEYGRTAGIVTPRTSSRRSWGRSPTRPTPPAAPCGGWPAASGSSAAMSRSPTWRTTACTSRSTPTPTTRWEASCSPSSGRLPKRGDQVTADGYSIRVESVRENRIEAVRIRHRKAPAEAPATAE